MPLGWTLDLSFFQAVLKGGDLTDQKMGRLDNISVYLEIFDKWKKKYIYVFGA